MSIHLNQPTIERVKEGNGGREKEAGADLVGLTHAQK